MSEPAESLWRRWGRSRDLRRRSLCCLSRSASPTSCCARAGTRSRTACCGTRGRRVSRRSLRRPGRRPRARVSSRAMFCLQSTAPGSDDSRGHRIPASRSRRHPPRIYAPSPRVATSVGRLARTDDRAAGDLFRARRRRSLHAARGRVGAAPPAARSGDAALFLAVRRVLRLLHVLVQRSVRSARLGVLLG